MNDLSPGLYADKLQPLRTERFEAFITQDMKWHNGEARRVDIDASTLEEAAAQASLKAAHKAIFFVKRTDEFNGKVTLHFFVVKRRSQPVYIRPPGMAHTVQHRPLYAEPLFDLALTDAVMAADVRSMREAG